jgi:hypothetical protein
MVREEVIPPVRVVSSLSVASVEPELTVEESVVSFSGVAEIAVCSASTRWPAELAPNHRNGVKGVVAPLRRLRSSRAST